MLPACRGPTTASERAPFRPGVVYNGIVLSITGESGLSAVRSPVYAGISELQLLDIPFAKVSGKEQWLCQVPLAGCFPCLWRVMHLAMDDGSVAPA